VSEPPASEPVAASQPRLLDRLRTLASRRPVADRRQRIRGEHVAVAYGVVAVAGLIVLRALVDGLDFLSIGWILVLAALPLLPWLLPRLGVFLRGHSRSCGWAVVRRSLMARRCPGDRGVEALGWLSA
jgi:hypothetical protein